MVDKKIILTVLIVALIGVVAATYHTTTGNDSVYEPLVSVVTETGDSISDLATTGDSQNSKPTSANDNSVNNGESISSMNENTNSNGNTTTNTSASTENDNSNGISETNGQISSSNSSSSNKNTNTDKTNNNSIENNNKNTISISGATSKAQNWAYNHVDSGVTASYLSTSGNEYIIGIYKSGSLIGEIDVNINTGLIDSCAFKGETPDPSKYTSDIDDYNNNTTK